MYPKESVQFPYGFTSIAARAAAASSAVSLAAGAAASSEVAAVVVERRVERRGLFLGVPMAWGLIRSPKLTRNRAFSVLIPYRRWGLAWTLSRRAASARRTCTSGAAAAAAAWRHRGTSCRRTSGPPSSALGPSARSALGGALALRALLAVVGLLKLSRKP